MTRVWFNRTFSNVRALLDLVRRGDEGGEFHLVCTHTQASFPGFAAAHEWALEPAGLTGPGYIDYCLDFCRERRIDALWPGKEARLLAEHRDRFAAEGVRVLSVASPENLDLLHDKARFSAQARHFFIPTPDTLECRTLEEFEAAYERLRALHPVLCIKPAKGVNGAGFRVIEEGRRGLDILVQGVLYAIHLDGLRQLLREAGAFEPLLLMEHLDGAEYSVDSLGDGRRLVALTQRRKETGAGYGQRITALPALTQAVAELTEIFGLTGLFNAQFREGRNGLRLLEINPRFAGGIGYTGATSVNLPYLALHGLIRGFADDGPPLVAEESRILEVPDYARIEVVV
ncbi:ATP-grasp domain-containing protein [Thiocystis violacea]|uniref:ATP-grasp domain-containing protein n=1 Tax=Thiocystis violacea TaxID=13725 RepID=UPI001907019F|nr:ATP-grasp domain-containing protein [Thiocystis violacea]MBK1717656.1 biotin carboxylase [Thiocystis violacea]